MKVPENLLHGEEKTLLFYLPEPALVLSRKGRVVYLNPAFRRRFKIEREQSIGLPMEKVLPRWLSSPLAGALSRENGVSGHSFRVNDQRASFRVSLRSIDLKGKTAGAMVLLSEETGEQDRAKLNLSLLRAMAQDLLLPIEEVKSLMIRPGPMPENMKKSASSQLNQLNENLARILTFGEVLFGQVRPERGPFQPNRLISLTLKSLRPLAQERLVHLIDGSSRELPMVEGDPGLLSRFLALAADYIINLTPAGEVVALSGEVLLAKNGEPVLSYTVTGTGISGADLYTSLDETRLQEHFVMAPDSRKSSMLRLLLAQRLIRAMSGSINFAAHESSGLAFSAAIPAPIHYPAAAGKVAPAP